MNRILITIAAVAGIALAGSLADPFEASAQPATGPYTGPLVPQVEFPCAEDEVLGYAPEFGYDHVGCIHIDRV